MGYKFVRPGKRAEDAVAQNPEKSDRAIAADLGVSDTTVYRARKSKKENGKHAGASNEATAKRKGRDGKSYRATKPDKIDRGPRVSVPDGSTLEAVCRRGMELEEGKLSARDIARKIGVGVQSYCEGRTVILLSDRKDLSAEERFLVGMALTTMNHEQRTRQSHMLVSPLADRIWGKRKPRTDQSEKRQLDVFENAMGIVIQSCISGADIPIPRLDSNRRNALLTELDEAMAALRRLITRIKNLKE